MMVEDEVSLNEDFAAKKPVIDVFDQVITTGLQVRKEKKIHNRDPLPRASETPETGLLMDVES